MKPRTIPAPAQRVRLVPIMISVLRNLQDSRPFDTALRPNLARNALPALHQLGLIGRVGKPPRDRPRILAAGRAALAEHDQRRLIAMADTYRKLRAAS